MVIWLIAHIQDRTSWPAWWSFQYYEGNYNSYKNIYIHMHTIQKSGGTQVIMDSDWLIFN